MSVVSSLLDSSGAISVNVLGGACVCPTLSIAAARAIRQRQGFPVLFGKYKSFTIHTMHSFLNGNAVMSEQPPSEQSC